MIKSKVLSTEVIMRCYYLVIMRCYYLVINEMLLLSYLIKHLCSQIDIGLKSKGKDHQYLAALESEPRRLWGKKRSVYLKLEHYPLGDIRRGI